MAKADQYGGEARESASLHSFPLDCESHCRPERGSYRISLKKFCRKDYGRLPHSSPSILPPTPLYLDPGCISRLFLSSGLPRMRALTAMSSMDLPLLGGLVISFLRQLNTTFLYTVPSGPAPPNPVAFPRPPPPQRCRWQWVRAARPAARGPAFR